MDDHQDVQDQFTDTESVRVARARLCTLKKFKKARQTQQAVESQKWGVADPNAQIKKVRWEDGASV